MLLPPQEVNVIRRTKILRREGFLPFEIKVLSHVTFGKCPYMVNVRAARKDIRRIAWENRWTLTKYRMYIINLYRVSDWRRRDKEGRIRLSPQEMLKDYKREYQGKHPDYVSPGEKRPKKDRLDFIEQQLKYPRGGYY